MDFCMYYVSDIWVAPKRRCFVAESVHREEKRARTWSSSDLGDSNVWGSCKRGGATPRSEKTGGIAGCGLEAKEGGIFRRKGCSGEVRRRNGQLP